MNLPPPPTRAHANPEALFAREMLRALGQLPDVAIYNNEVGRGYTGNVRAHLAQAFASRADIATIIDGILVRHRITYGMGVGSPDYAAFVGGVGLLIETKSHRGVLSDAQVTWHEAARSRGVRVIVPRDVDTVLRTVEVVRGGGVP